MGVQTGWHSEPISLDKDATSDSSISETQPPWASVTISMVDKIGIRVFNFFLSVQLALWIIRGLRHVFLADVK